METAAVLAFDSLDVDRRGAIGVAALQRQHEQLHGAPIARQHVEAAVRAVCGGDALTVSRGDFFAVLEEMQKRCAMEVAARWNYSLLAAEEGTISLEQAFYLFKALLASGFVTSAFGEFLSTRLASANPGARLCWQDIQQLLWLLPDVHLSAPAMRHVTGTSYDDDGYDGSDDNASDSSTNAKSGEPAGKDGRGFSSTGGNDNGGSGAAAVGGAGVPSASLYQTEQLGQQLAWLSAERCAAAAAAVKRKFADSEDENSYEINKEREVYADTIRAGAKMKLLRWEDEGLSSMLNDNSYAKSGLLYLVKTRNNPDLVEVSHIHERKYSALRKLLLKSLARTQRGDLTWETLTDEEQELACEPLTVAEKQLRRQLDPAAAMATTFPGASLPFKTTDGYASLNAILGQLIVSDTHTDVPSTVRRYLTARGDSRLAVTGGDDDGIGTTFGTTLMELNDRERAELWLVTSSWMAGRRIDDVAAGLGIYLHLKWQLLTIENYDNFEAAALAAGLRERAPYALTDSRVRRLDRPRYESLSARVISSSSDDILYGLSSATIRQTPLRELSGFVGKMELFDAILSTFQLKHVAEREELLRIVHRPVFLSTRLAPLPKSPLEKASLLAVLRGRRSRWRETASAQRSPEEHDAILQEAVAIYYNQTKKKMTAEGKGSSERGTLIRIMADLLEEQEREFARVLDDLPDKDIPELQEIYATQEQARCGGFFDNVAALTIGDMALIAAEQQISDQLQQKYNCLRLRLIEYSLLAEFGVGWLGRSEADRQHLINQRDDAYRKHVQDGDLTAAEQLLGDAAFDFTVHQLLGESRADFATRLAAAEQTSSEKEPQQTSVEAALQNRFFAERSALLDWLHTEVVDGRLLQKRLALEAFLVVEAADYLSAAYGVGLLERLLPAGRKRHREDTERLMKLSKVHVDNYQQRYRMGIKLVKKPVAVPTSPDEDDGASWLEVTVKVTLSKHVDEQEALLRILTDSSLQDLCSVAAAMSREEQQRRLVELQNKQRWLVVNSEASHHENLNILEESAAIRWVMLKNAAVKRDDVLTDSELFTQIMATLVELQHDELAGYLAASSIKSAFDLAAAYRDQTMARKWNVCKNVCTALTAYDGPCPDAMLGELLREKYTCLTRKYVETFYGERTPGWLELKPEERADKISKFCADVEQLRSAGKSAELAGLYRDYGMEPIEFVSIFGDNQFEFLRKLLASLKQNSGGGSDSADGAVWDALAVAAGLKEETRPVDRDLLAELERRRMEEWQCLSHLLQGVHGVFWGDSGRFAEAIRLRHQVAMCSFLENVTEVGHYCTLVDRIQMIVHLAPSDVNWRRHLLSRDWSRLIELGHELLLTLDERVNSAKKFKPSIIEAPPGCDRKTLMEAVFQLQQQRQSQEARALHAILTSVTEEQTAIAAKLSRSGRNLKLAVLQQTASRLGPNDIAKRNDCLRAAAILKLSTPPDQMDADSSPTERKKDVSVASILAELIEKHIYESALLLRAFNEKDDDDVLAMQAQLVSQLRTGAVPMVLKIMLRSGRLPRQKEHELADAVHSKYDAAQDRLLLHVMASTSGDLWKGMTELQRHNALGELRDTVKKLVLQGQTVALKELIDTVIGSFKGLVPAGSSVMQCLQDWCNEEIQMRLEQMNVRMVAAAAAGRATATTGFTEVESRDDVLWNKELDLLRRDRRRVGLEPGAGACIALLRLLSLSQDSPECEQVSTVLAMERARALLGGVRTVTDWTDDSAPAAAAAAAVAAGSEGDSSVLLDEIVDVLELRHKDERETLVRLVIENKDRLGSAMPETEHKQKLEDLAELRLRLLNALQLSSTAHASILEEAMAHQCVLRMLLKPGRATSISGADETSMQLHSSFLAELTSLQEKERTSVMAGMALKAPYALVRMLTLYKVARQRQWNDNIAAVLLPPVPGEQPDRTNRELQAAPGMQKLASELVAAVEGKFEVARDGLLMECMRLQRSAAEWQALSESDRHRLVMDFHRKVVQLKAEGKHDEASAAVRNLLSYTDRDVERHEKLSATVRQQLAAEGGVSVEEVSKDEVLARVNRQLLDEGNRRVEVYSALGSRLESEKARMLEVAADDDAPLLLIWLRLERSRVVMSAYGKQWDEKSSAAAADAALAVSAEQELNDVMTSFSTGDKDSQLEVARQQLSELLKADKAEGSGSKDAQVPPLLRHARWLVATLAHGKDAREILQEALIDAVHRKHQMECKLFVNLMQHVTDSHDMLRQAEYLGLPKMLKALEKLETDMNTWRVSNKDSLGTGQPLASSAREELMIMLQKAALYRTMVEVYQHESVPADNVTDEQLQSIFAAILADIRSCQASEEQSVNELLLGESNDILEELVGIYTSAQLIAWVDNLAAGLLLVLDDPDKWVTETRRLRVEDKNYQAEKQRLLDQMILHGLKKFNIDGEEVDAMEYLKKTELEQAAQKQAGVAEVQKQKAAVAARRAARQKEQQQAASNEQPWLAYGATFAIQLVTARVGADDESADDSKEPERAKRLAKMKEKMAERQFARSKISLSDRLGSAARSRSASPTSQSLAGRGAQPLGSKENAEEVLGKMVRDHSKVKEKLTAEEKKQQELIKKKRDNMKAQKESEVMSLLTLGERQKTTLEKSRKEDRSRQDTMVEERISRIRQEKTLTSKGASTPGKKFTDMVESTVDGADRDQKMVALAKELEQKLKAQDHNLHHREENVQEDQDQFSPANALADEERMRIIKEKRAMKRLKRRESFTQQ